MRKSFIHYNRRDIRLRFPSDPRDPWFSEFQNEFEGFERPRYHVTRAVDGPAAEVEPGDTIWLVGQLYAPWGEHLPAALDARIDVLSVGPRREGPGYRYAASDSSRWFPLSEATAQLHGLETSVGGHVDGPLWKDRNRAIGHYLRRMRKLSRDDALREWEKQLLSRPLHFISYRIIDGTRAAFTCAKHLMDQRTQIFWDRWSLPRRLAERREAVGDQPLDETIEAGIQQAKVVWGIESPRYGAEGSYAARERDFAKKINKYRAFGAY